MVNSIDLSYGATLDSLLNSLAPEPTTVPKQLFISILNRMKIEFIDLETVNSNLLEFKSIYEVIPYMENESSEAYAIVPKKVYSNMQALEAIAYITGRNDLLPQTTS